MAELILVYLLGEIAFLLDVIRVLLPDIKQEIKYIKDGVEGLMEFLGVADTIEDKEIKIWVRHVREAAAAIKRIIDDLFKVLVPSLDETQSITKSQVPDQVSRTLEEEEAAEICGVEMGGGFGESTVVKCGVDKEIKVMILDGVKSQASSSSSSYKDRWVIDSGAGEHITGCKDILSNPVAGVNHTRFHLANGSTREPQFRGSVDLASISLHLPEVFYLSGSSDNILSVSKITLTHCSSVTFYHNYCIFRDHDERILWRGTKSNGGLYVLDTEFMAAPANNPSRAKQPLLPSTRLPNVSGASPPTFQLKERGKGLMKHLPNASASAYNSTSNQKVRGKGLIMKDLPNASGASTSTSQLKNRGKGLMEDLPNGSGASTRTSNLKVRGKGLIMKRLPNASGVSTSTSPLKVRGKGLIMKRLPNASGVPTSTSPLKVRGKGLTMNRLPNVSGVSTSTSNQLKVGGKGLMKRLPNVSDQEKGLMEDLPNATDSDSTSTSNLS